MKNEELGARARTRVLGSSVLVPRSLYFEFRGIIDKDHLKNKTGHFCPVESVLCLKDCEDLSDAKIIFF